MGTASRAGKNNLLVYLVIFLVLAFSSSVFANLYDSPPHASVLANNMLAVRSLSHSDKPSWVVDDGPNPFQPITWAYVYVGPASPSSSNDISSLHSPSIFWNWGEHHKTPYISSEPENECGPHVYELTALGNATANFSMSANLDGQTITQPLDNSSNPFNLSFSKVQWAAVRSNNRTASPSPLPPLTVTINGTVYVPYHFYEKYFIIEYAPVLGSSDLAPVCTLVEDEYDTVYSRSFSANRTWGVEHGEPLFIRLEPIDGEQLSLHPNARLLTLTNRNPMLLSFLLSGQPLVSSRFSRYNTSSDEFGFQSVQRVGAGPEAEWANVVPNDSSSYLLEANSTFRYLLPTALDAKNRSFAWQFNQFLRYPLPLGESNLSLVLTDDFRDIQNASWQLRTRSSAGIGGANPQNASLHLLDDRVNASLPPLTDLGGGVSSANLPPSTKWRGAAAVFFTPAGLSLLLGGVIGIAICFFLFTKFGHMLSFSNEDELNEGEKREDKLGDKKIRDAEKR